MDLKKYLLLFFMILFLAFSGCTKDKSNINGNDEVIASIGKDYVITLNELKKNVSDWHFVLRFRNKSVAYNNALNIMIINQLKLIDFFDRNLNENKDLMKEISRYINYELINTYFDKNFIEKYANEKNAAKAYKEMDKEIIFDEIILPVPGNSTKKSLDSLKTVAMNVEDGFSNGYSIQELVKLNSLTNIIINNQKSMTWWQSIMDPVSNVVFNLKKGYTRVLESEDGFHIVKVLDIKKIKLEPFEKIKDKIISQLQKGFYQASDKAFDNFRNELIDKNSIKWNQKGLDQIVKWSSKDAHFYGGAYKDIIQNAISNGNDFKILSYNNGNVDLKEYLRLLDEIIIPNSNTILNPGNVKEFILNAVYNDNVAKAAKKLGLEKELVNPHTKDPIIKNKIVYLYNKAVIDGSIPEATTEALHKFYEAQKDSIFYQLKLVYIYARIYSDSAKAAADINKIKKGTPFEKIKESYYIKEYIRERDGSLKAYRTAGGDYLAKAAFALKLNQSAGPIEFNDSTKGKQFAVINCFKILPEKQLTFDDVKGKRIEEEFKNYYFQKISDEIYAKLKQKYGVKIFENALSKAIAAK